MTTIYHHWLGIPLAEQPPTPYRLLGVKPGERNLAVLEEAALQRMALIRAWQQTHPEESTRLQNEIAWALDALSDIARRSTAVAEQMGLTVLVMCQEQTTQPTLWQVHLRPVPLSDQQRDSLAKRVKRRKGRGTAHARILHRDRDGQTEHTKLIVALGPCHAVV